MEEAHIESVLYRAKPRLKPTTSLGKKGRNIKEICDRDNSIRRPSTSEYNVFVRIERRQNEKQREYGIGDKDR